MSGIELAGLVISVATLPVVISNAKRHYHHFDNLIRSLRHHDFIGDEVRLLSAQLGNYTNVVGLVHHCLLRQLKRCGAMSPKRGLATSSKQKSSPSPVVLEIAGKRILDSLVEECELVNARLARLCKVIEIICTGAGRIRVVAWFRWTFMHQGEFGTVQPAMESVKSSLNMLMGAVSLEDKIATFAHNPSDELKREIDILKDQLKRDEQTIKYLGSEVSRLRKLEARSSTRPRAKFRAGEERAQDAMRTLLNLSRSVRKDVAERTNVRAQQRPEPSPPHRQTVPVAGSPFPRLRKEGKRRAGIWVQVNDYSPVSYSKNTSPPSNSNFPPTNFSSVNSSSSLTITSPVNSSPTISSPANSSPTDSSSINSSLVNSSPGPPASLINPSSLITPPSPTTSTPPSVQSSTNVSNAPAIQRQTRQERAVLEIDPYDLSVITGFASRPRDPYSPLPSLTTVSPYHEVQARVDPTLSINAISIAYARQLNLDIDSVHDDDNGAEPLLRSRSSPRAPPIPSCGKATLQWIEGFLGREKLILTVQCHVWEHSHLKLVFGKQFVEEREQLLRKNSRMAS